jgi:type I restriction enzyme S subunit
MRSEWKKYTLGQLFNSSSGLSKPRDKFGYGNPFVSFKDVFDNFFLPDNLGNFVDTTEEEIQRFSVMKGDVFLTRTSETPNELAMSSVALKDYPKATFNGFTKRLRIKEDVAIEIDPVYVGYYLRSSKFRRTVYSFSEMTTRASLNNSSINGLEITIPTIQIQKKIGTILKSLDDKILLYMQINSTLESMAQALFKSWFVDFDPVKAKMKARASGGDDEAVRHAAMTAISGKPPKELDKLKHNDPKSYKSLEQTADLFPEAMVESELGEIPEGWEVKTLGELSLNITDGVHSTVKDNVNGEFYLLSCKNVKNGEIIIGDSERKIDANTLEQLRKRTRLAIYDILLTTVGTIGETAMVRDSNINYEFQRSVAIIKTNIDCCLPEYLYQVVRSNSFISKAMGRSEGSVQKCLFLGPLKTIEILQPDLVLQNFFDSKVKTIYAHVKHNFEENKRLANIRDALLPKLLSGEIDLSTFTPQIQELTAK